MNLSRLPRHAQTVYGAPSNAAGNRQSQASSGIVSVTLIILALASVVACARMPVPTSDATLTPEPSSTMTRAARSATPATPLLKPDVGTATPSAIPLPNEAHFAVSPIAGSRATAKCTPTPVLTPIAYDRNPRAILVEADISGGLERTPRGAHVPLFRLYGDGFVVFAGEPADLSTGLDAVAKTGTLDERVIQQILAFVRDTGFYNLGPLYQPVPLPADLPTARITVNLDKAKTVRVYAPGMGDRPAAFYEVFNYLVKCTSTLSDVFTPGEGYLVAVPAGAVSDFRSKDVLAEWPPNIGVRLADATDGTMVRSTGYASVVALIAQTFPDTLYREGDRVYRVEFHPQLPRAVYQTDWVGAILEAPREFEGRTFDIVGYFRGANLLGEAAGNPPVTRSDWVIADETGAVYVTGGLPPGLDPHSRSDIWSLVRVRGVVVYVRLGTSHLAARQVQVLSRSAPTETPVVAATVTPPAAASATVTPPTSTRAASPLPIRTQMLPGSPKTPPATATLSQAPVPTPLGLATKAPGGASQKSK